MACDLGAYERALRQLPLPYSLALRLRAAGAAPDAICEYVDVEPGAAEPSCVNRMWHLAFGNVLFLRQLVIQEIGASASDQPATRDRRAGCPGSVEQADRRRADPFRTHGGGNIYRSCTILGLRDRTALARLMGELARPSST